MSRETFKEGDVAMKDDVQMRGARLCGRLAAAIALAATVMSGCQTAPDEAERTVALRVGSSNIRYPNKGDDKAGNGWDARKGDLIALLRRLDMDVFGMQEVHDDIDEYRQLSDMAAGMKEWEFVDDYGVTTAVAYRRARFDLVRKGVFWLSETPDVPHSLGWGAKNIRPCLWIVWKDKASGKEFCFVNTHTDHRVEAARVNGTKLILERMKTFAKGLPIVFVGDHNTNPDTPASALVREVLKDARTISETKDPGPVNSFHRWGTIKDDPRRRIDYIYVSDGIRVRAFATHADKRPGLDRWPSDHYPVTADIEF